MRVSRFALTTACVLLLALGSSCKKTPKTYLNRVEVVLSGDDDGAILGLTTEQVKALVEAKLPKRGFVLPSKDEALPKDIEPWKFSLGLVVEPPTSRTAEAKVRAVALLERKSDAAEYELQTEASEKPRGDSLDEHRDAAKNALDTVIEQSTSRMGKLMVLASLPDGELVPKLIATPSDEAEQSLVLKILADRKNPAAVEPLIARLSTDDLNEARRAMGQLLQIGDRRAVPAMIEASRGRDEMFQREVVFALGALGGDEAEAYLMLMAEGHDQPLMRASAKEALDEMKGHRDGGHEVTP